MSTTWWLRVWGCAAVMGALASPLVLEVVPAVAALVGGAAIGAVARGILAPARSAIDWSLCSGYLGLCGAAFAAQVAAIQVCGPSALGVALLAAATSPWAVRWLRAGLLKLGLVVPQTPVPSARQEPVADPQFLGLVRPIHLFIPIDATPEWASRLDTARLCHAWRRSFLGLEVAQSSAETQEVARVRQLLLDELNDRHPREVSEWLSAGGRAASGPERVLARAGRRSSEQRRKTA